MRLSLSQCRPGWGSLLTTLWLSILVTAPAATGWGQESGSESGLPASLGDGGLLFSDTITGKSGNALGGVFRVGVETGEAVGRQDTIVPFEFMPYGFVFDDEGMMFGDFRVFRSTRDGWGANVGTGYRHYLSTYDRIIGANYYYDYDNTSGALFRSMGFGLETYGELWDARANAYFQHGNEPQLLSAGVVPGSARFAGYNVRFDIERVFGEAMSGVDFELGTPLPGRILKKMDARVYAGAYHFRTDSENSMWGWKGRLQANVIPSVQLALEVTNDKIFDTNVVFGAQWSFGGYRQPDGEPKTQKDRMTTPVRRFYNVVVSRSSVIERDVVAVNPQTGQPYLIEHVASYAAPGGDGSYENPFDEITDAQANYFIDGIPGFTAGDLGAVPGDIIYTWANSVFDGGANAVVTLEEGVRLLGEGDLVRHQVFLPGIGSVDLPRATAFSNRPMLINGIGDGVTLADNAEFSGFVLGDPNDPTTGPTGAGIIGSGVSNVILRYNDINNPGGEGILLTNTVGLVDFQGVQVTNPGETGLDVIGGGGQITFSDDALTLRPGFIRKTGGTGFGVRVLNTDPTPGTRVDLFRSAQLISDLTTSGVDGVRIENAGTQQVTIGNTNIATAPNNAIAVLAGSGNVNFAGTQTISQPSAVTGNAGNAILIFDRPALTSTVFQQNVNITDRNGRGLNLLSNAGTVSFNNPVSITANAAALPTVAAVEYQDSSGSVFFGGTSSLTITGGAGTGIVIGELGTNNTGQFRVNGQTNINSIVNGIDIFDDQSQIRFNGVAIDDRSGFGISIIDHSVNGITFDSTTTVGNSQAALAAAVGISGNTSSIAFETLALTDSEFLGLAILDNTSFVSIQDFDAQSNSGPTLFVRNAGVVTPLVNDPQFTTQTNGGVQILDGDIDATGGRAVDIEDSVYDINLTSVSATGGINGIRLVNNFGFGRDQAAQFIVTGLNGAPGTGGSIQNTTGAGVLATDTGVVSLQAMTIQNSGGNGIFASNTAPFLNSTPVYATQLEVLGTTVQGNAAVGILANNVPIVNIEDSIVSNNTGSEISLLASIGRLNQGDLNEFDANYFWFLDGNTVTEAQAGVAAISATSTNTTTNVQFDVINSVSINHSGAGGEAILATAGGNWVSLIGANTINMTGAGTSGIVYQGNSVTSNTTLQILSNVITGTTAAHTGIDVSTLGAANIDVGNANGLPGNLIQLTGNNSINAAVATIGMNFNLAANNNVNVFNNTIVINDDGGQGMVFQSLFGPSNVVVSGNDITVNGLFGFFVEYGIRFQTITGLINLSGPANNNVTINNGGGTFFFFQALNPAQINGQISVNGVSVP